LAGSLAVGSAAGWTAFLTLLGLGAATGIGGGVGLLIVIVPALILLVFNCVALRAPARCGDA
jgi:Fe2+ transport system protein B